MRSPLGIAALALAAWMCSTTATRAQAVTGRTVETHEIFLSRHSHSHPTGAPDAVIALPTTVHATEPLHLVIFLHGWSGCARVLAATGPTACVANEAPKDGWGLAAILNTVPANTVLLIPQLAWQKRDGTPGKFANPAFVRSYMDEIRRTPAVRDALGGHPIASTTLVAHSAGYETALAFLRGDPITMDRVVLMDALYGEGAAFARWVTAKKGRHVLSFFTGNASTYQESKVLLRMARRRLGSDAVLHARNGADAPFAAHAVLIGRVPYKHSEIPTRMLGPVLTTLLAAHAP